MTAHLDHGFVANGRIAALVAPQSQIDWLCMPSFDAPSVLGALLDDDRGGQFAFEVEDPQAKWSQRYQAESNVLITRCECATGVFEVVDAAVFGDDDGAAAELVRLVRPISGAPEVRLVFDPRLDYGRSSPTIAFAGRSIRAGELSLAIDRDLAELALERPVALTRPLAMVLSWLRPVTAATEEAVSAAIERSVALDRAYVAALDHRGDERLIRAALVLRGHTAPSGAIAAATTTSVPEAIGTARTWDYRYAWVRDSCFAARALLALGDQDAADRLLDFFAKACADGAPPPVVGLDGRRDLPESELPHLAGFADSGPVRIGNAAALQSQHDSTGQLIWLAHELAAAQGPCDRYRLAWVGRLADEAARRVGTPDAGIWEFRDRPAVHTISQAWLWVGLDRAAALLAESEPDRASAFAAAAHEARDALVAAAERAGFYAQTLDGDEVDASSLQLASLGLVAADDPRFVETLERVENELDRGGLLARYQIEDDLGETTSAFSLCQLWRIAALAMTGRGERAAELLTIFTALENPVGLFAEDIEPASGRQLGNFPQVYTHTGLIEAILALRGS